MSASMYQAILAITLLSGRLIAFDIKLKKHSRFCSSILTLQACTFSSNIAHEPLREDQDCETGQLIKEMGEDELQTSIDNHTKVQETQDQQLEMRLAGPQVPLIETGVYSQRPKSKARVSIKWRRTNVTTYSIVPHHSSHKGWTSN